MFDSAGAAPPSASAGTASMLWTDAHVEVVVRNVEIQAMVPGFSIVIGADVSLKRGPCCMRVAGDSRACSRACSLLSFGQRSFISCDAGKLAVP